MSGEDAVKVIGSYSEFLSRAERQVRNYADAQDVAQEAFLELVKRPDLNYANPVAAMKRIIHNEGVDLCKKRGRASHEEFVLEQIVAPEPDEELQGMLFVLHRAIDGLPAGYRSIVRDKLDGLGYGEISAKYQISVEAARIRFYRACLVLKEKLIAYDLEDKPPARLPLPLAKSNVA